MIAVAITLFLAVLTARNNAVYHDIAQYAAAQGELAARVINRCGAVRREGTRCGRHGAHPVTLTRDR